MPSSSVPVPEWWLGSQDSLQAITHATPCAAHPALLLPLSAAYLPPTSVAMASVDDAASCVVELTCRDPLAATDDDLAAAPALPHLKALVLEACDNLTAAATRHISQSKTLEDLRLDGTPVDDDGFQHLTDLAPTLRRLSIAHCRGTSIDGFKSIASLRRLTALNLSFCVELDAAALSHVTTLDGLTELDVHGCHNVGPEGVSSLAALSRLTKLDIGCCGVDDASLTTLSASLPSLKWLCLHKCGSVPAAVFKALPQLTHLDVSHCTLDGAGVTRISSMAALTSLNLWRAEGVTSEAFVKFTALTNLRELNLDGCQEITAAALAPLAVLPNLTDVNTDDTAALDELDELIALVKRLSPPACPTNALTLFVHDFDDDDDDEAAADDDDDDDYDDNDDDDDVEDHGDDVDGATSLVDAHHQEQSETDTRSDEDASSAPGRVVGARLLYTYLRRAMEDGDESSARKLLLQADACDIGNVLRHAVAAKRWDDPLACRILSLLIEHVDLTTCGADLVINSLNNGHLAAARQLVDRGAPFPALHRAALFGDNDAVAIVLKDGTDVEYTDDSVKGWTAVHVAASCGHLDIVTFLRDSGADVEAKDNEGATPMHWAALDGHLDTVTFLHDSGAHVNAKSDKGTTPMHWAAWNGHRDTVTFLRDSGAEVNAEDDIGRTPMHFAAGNGQLDTVTFLRDSGAPVNAKNDKGGTPMHWAAWNGHLDTLTFLRDSGADVKANTDDGITPMHVAAQNGHLDTVTFLRDSGAQVNAKNDKGGTPMHWAAENGHLDTLTFLRDSGADVNANADDGSTPMHWAAWNGHRDTVTFLRDSGAQVNAKNDKGGTPIHWAAENGHLDTLAFLRDSGADVSANTDDGITPIHRAAVNGHLDIVTFLRDSGADVEAKDNEGATPMHWAALDGHLDTVTFLHDSGAHVTAKSDKGITPMHWAAQNGHLDAVTFLRDSGADVNANADDGTTPMHVAAQNGHLDTVTFLRDSGAEVNAEDDIGRTPMHVAAGNGQLDTVTFLRDSGAPVNAQNDKGGTPIHWAAENGHLDTLTFLHDSGADVNANADDGITPIHRAAVNGHLDIVTFLRDSGAQVNAKNDKGGTPIHWAAQNGHLDTVTFLRDSGAEVNAEDDNGRTPMHFAAGNGHLDTVTFLRDSGADVNSKDNEGATPMHWAAENGHLETVTFLLDSGADVNAQTDAGSAPIHFAAVEGHLDTVSLLCDSGADVNAKAHNGGTPIHWAAENGHLDIVTFLRDSGADVNANADDGSTPMHEAAMNGHLDTVTFLRDSGADVNSKDNEGATPMHWAAQDGHLEIVTFLLDSGADVNANADDGSTPMHEAAMNGHLDTVTFLRDSGADVNSKDNEGATPMHWAAQDGHLEIVTFLRDSGADMNANADDGSTPIRWAALHGHLDTVTFLCDSGGDANAKADTVQEHHGGPPVDAATVLLKLWGGELTARNADGATRACGHVDTGDVPETTPREPLVVAAEQELQGQGRAMSASSEAALVEVLGDVSAVMAGPNGWAAPPEACAVAVTLRRGGELRVCRDKLSNMLADLGNRGRSVPPEEVAQCRADCCVAAEQLLHLLPPMAAAAPGGPHPCVRGIAALRRPPPELLREFMAAAVVAEQAHARGLEAVAQAASQKGHGALAAAVQAAHRANDECGEHAEALRAKLREARCSTMPMGCGDLTAEECGHLRAAADAVLAEEGPWAGAAGLERRAAALASVTEAVAARHSAHRAVKAAARAVAKAELDVHSSDDENAAEEAKSKLREARAVHDAALPALLTATAAVQAWATSGEGALALQAFPGDAELAAARAALLHAEFRADTVLPQTPDVDMGTEYPDGLHDAPSPYVYYAGRRCGGGVRPVVLRRLRLGTAALVGQARRQLRDAGRIAVGLRACPDAAAGFPGVVAATRWFVATMPGGTTKTPDAWLEFPRAPFGSLAEVVDAVDSVVFTAAGGAGFCMRLARAVAQLHAAGIRHGDLKPDNVVLWDDSESDLVRPGIIDLLDTAVVGATQTLRGVTLEWLPPEASAARADGRKVYATRELDCWQLGRICEAALDATAPLPEQLQSVRAAASALCAREPGDRVAAATAFLTMEAAVAGAAGSHAELQWALPPRLWQCERGAAPGVDYVELDAATDPAAIALVACATEVGRVVDAVYRLENLRLWHVYAAELARVAEQAQGAAWPQRLADEAAVTFAPHGAAALSQEPQGGPSTGEALLLHGAPTQSLRSIAEVGFDPSYSGVFNGALFGAATCLTPLWAKAANEYACLRGDGVLVTRAAVGHVADCLATPHTETRLYRRPPDGHHSVLGDNDSPGAVVAMYRPSQMYPEYLVVFGNDHVRAD